MADRRNTQQETVKIRWQRRKRADPEYRRKQQAAARVRRRCRMVQDPEYRERQRVNARRWRSKPSNRLKRAQESCARSRALRLDPKQWPKQILRTIKARALRDNLPFTLLETDIVVPSACPVFGFKLVFGGGRNNPRGPSVDRIIPEFGYVKGNIKVISIR